MFSLILYLYALVAFGGAGDFTANDSVSDNIVHIEPLPEQIPALVPVAESLLHAGKNLPPTPEYQADADAKTLYFGSDGLAVETAAPGGYYRKVLGKTADGRLAVQDFYQDNDQAQTEISLLVKDADPSDFSFDPVDSKTVWYRPDGSIKFIADMQAGKLLGYYNHYLDNLLIAQYDLGTADETTLAELPGWGRIDNAFFYPDGRYMTAYVQNGQQTYAIYFRTDGSPILALNFNYYDPAAPHEGTYRAWKADGSPAPLDEAQKEIEAIEQTLATYWQQYQDDL